MKQEAPQGRIDYLFVRNKWIEFQRTRWRFIFPFLVKFVPSYKLLYLDLLGPRAMLSIALDVGIREVPRNLQDLQSWITHLSFIDKKGRGKRRKLKL